MISKNETNSEANRFRHVRIAEGGTVKFHSAKMNSLVFLMRGSISFSVENRIRLLTSQKMLGIQKGCRFTYKVRQDSKLIIFSFGKLQYACDKRFLQGMAGREEYVHDPLKTVPIGFPLECFLDTVAHYLDTARLNCPILHEIKEKELFLILRAFHKEEELVNLFHEIAGDLDFRSFILQNYMKANSIKELASRLNMRRTTFDMKFRHVFGASAVQWIMKHKAQRIQNRAADPHVTRKDLMEEFNFHSETHFNWFCLKMFGCTPLRLILKCQKHDREIRKEITCRAIV